MSVCSGVSFSCICPPRRQRATARLPLDSGFVTSGCPAAIERPLSGGQIASRLRRLGVGRTFSRAVRADFLQPICLQLATTVRCSLETCHWIAGPHRCLDDCNRSATDRPSRGHERQQPLQSGSGRLQTASGCLQPVIVVKLTTAVSQSSRWNESSSIVCSMPQS